MKMKTVSMRGYEEDHKWILDRFCASERTIPAVIHKMRKIVEKAEAGKNE